MLVIRLFRVGKKNQPSFKIVVTDKRKPPKAGRFVEQVGFWNPLTKEKVLKAERIKYWLSVGAKPSATLHNLLVSEKLVESKKIPAHKKSKKKEEPAKPQEPPKAAPPAEPKSEPQPEPQKEPAPSAEPEKPAEEKPPEESPKQE
jgi:small subunit ribosomal protein S16